VPWGDPADTVSLGTFYVRDVSATAPTLACEDQTGNSVANQAGDYLNTTDTRLRVLLSAVDDDTWWGCEDFTDMRTGYQYWGAVIVVKADGEIPISTAHTFVSTVSYNYYVFKVDGFADDTTLTDDDLFIYDIVFTTTLSAVSNVIIDVFDCQRYDNGFNTATFSGKLDATAITTKIA
jgi:hypothetical protein